MSLPHLTNADVIPDEPLSPKEARRRLLLRRVLPTLAASILLLVVIGFVTARHWLRQSMYDSLPQLDGSVSIPGLSAPVTIQRDAHGVPHIPAEPAVDLTAPQQNIPNVPLDESQTKLEVPDNPAGPSDTLSGPSFSASSKRVGYSRRARTAPARAPVTAALQDLLTLQQTLRNPICDNCFAGSGNWVVSGAHAADHQPLVSNDMHLTHNVPGIWYEADLETTRLHATGVSLPGVPFIIVGHNEHVAWGFTNLGAEVQESNLKSQKSSARANRRS